MILSMAQTNPVMFGMVADTPGVSQQLERMGRLKELLETDQGELKEKQREDWIRWVSRYRWDKNQNSAVPLTSTKHFSIFQPVVLVLMPTPLLVPKIF